MAHNYYSGQYEGAYNPRRLGNWEVPDRWPSRRAAFGKAHHKPRPIANDRGHLLPGVPRGPRGPWGCYRGTWDLPKRITKKQAEELSSLRPAPVQPSSYQKRSASSVPVPERSQAAQEAIDRAAEAAPQQTAEQPPPQEGQVQTSLSVNPGGVIHMSDFNELS